MNYGVSVALPAILFVVIVLAIWAGFGLVLQLRSRALARAFPDSETIAAVRTQALNSASDSYVDRGEWMDGPGAFPLTFVIVIDRDGVTFWKTRRAKIVSIRWTDLDSVRFVRIVQHPRTFRGIKFTVRSGGAVIDLPVIAIGRGPFGQFAQTERAIDDVCKHAERWRLASTPMS